MTRTLAIASLALLSLLGLADPAAAQESDHLACVAVKDPGASDEPLPVAISEIIDDEFSDCVIKKARMSTLCVRVAKNGGNDPLAGEAAAEAYACYKIKCGEGASDGSISVEDQFDSRLVERKGLRTLCTPVDLP